MVFFILILFYREGANFVDLFVRVSNEAGIGMYNRLGYVVYRHLIGYYSGNEDAFGSSFFFWLVFL
jgi:ribosomal protein S18 acetylase RimI-like enzyme